LKVGDFLVLDGEEGMAVWMMKMAALRRTDGEALGSWRTSRRESKARSASC